MLRDQAPAPVAKQRGAGRAGGKPGGRPVSEQGVLRNLHKRKSTRRGEDYDGEQLLCIPALHVETCSKAHCTSTSMGPRNY